ncbi:MAG: caspase family protein [Rhizobiaceae bacterium]|nr:caspase family protein [Rhizobiaceae bacterium]
MTPRIGRSLLSRAGALLLAALAFAAPVHAAETLRGVALVIGNGDYAHLPALANPANDADAIEAMLSDLGFDSVRRTNRDAATLARDLERFAEDAAGADVAVLYYSGHGIEAGGENFLIPIDADLSALTDASTKLVPLSPLIARLQNEVAVTIVLLDACRDNPFPADATLKITPDAAPIPVSTSGLSLETRGAVALTTDPAAVAKTLGTVIGFAAEPGKVALDGEPGGNSPYAAALLRHFSAMAGMEFGTVMRMVASEVYLKTNARQRPWVNESLVRLLYFGETPKLPAGEDGDILAERRGLLLRIDALPDLERRQVEMAALDSGVPMDALYGMLNVLGASAPAEGEELDAVLRTQTARLKDILAERQALKSADPEIVRLSALADRAIAEGALATALSIHEQAKARVKEIEAGLQQAAADLSARFVEAADVYARSAAAYEIAYDYGRAASDYAEAFRLVERWDAALAWKYKNAEAFALNRFGENAGDRAILEAAIDAAREAAALVSRATSPGEWAVSQTNLGFALQLLAIKDLDPAMLEQAAEAFRAALSGSRRDDDAINWASAQGNLAGALRELAVRNNDAGLMQEALAASRFAAEVLTPQSNARDWAMAKSNLGNALVAASRRFGDFDSLNAEALGAYRAALTELTYEAFPLAWSFVQNNLADALLDRGKRGDADAIHASIAAFREVLQRPVRDVQPLQWAKAQAGLGNALLALAASTEGTDELEAAAAAYRAALEEYVSRQDARGANLVRGNLGSVLARLGHRSGKEEHFREAVEMLRLASGEYRAREAFQSGLVADYDAGRALLAWARVSGSSTLLVEAAAAFEATLEGVRRSGWRPYRAPAYSGLGDSLFELFRREGTSEHLSGAVQAYRAAVSILDEEKALVEAAIAREKLGVALLAFGTETRDGAAIVEGRDAIAAAWEFHKANGNAAFASHFEGLLADADAKLKAIGG